MFRVDVRQPEAVGAALILIARAALLGDLDEAKRLEFPDSGPHRIAMNPELNELVVCHLQPAILSSSVMHVLGLEAMHHADR
jgi:hypothetical protein